MKNKRAALIKNKRVILVGVLVLGVAVQPAFSFSLGKLADLVTDGVQLWKKQKKDTSLGCSSIAEGGCEGGSGGGIFGGGDSDDTGGLFGGGGIFSTGGFNPNGGDLGGSDEDEKKPRFNPSYGGIDLHTLTKEDRTQEEDIDLFTKSTDLLLKKSIGYDSSTYTSAFGGLLKLLAKKSAKKTGDVLLGQEGQDDLGFGGREDEDDLLDDVGNILEKSDEIIGAIGVLIPEKVGQVAKEGQFLGEGGGIFGVNPVVLDGYMEEMAETEAISQSINTMFSEDGQAVTASLQASVEETAFQGATIADQAQEMKASLDISKAMTGQLAVLATNQNAEYAEALQHRLATTQGNQLASKLVKIETQRNWDDEFEKQSHLASAFRNAASFASLVTPASETAPETVEVDVSDLSSLSEPE